jgi:hypothetical protein
MKTKEELKSAIEQEAIEYCGEPLKDMDSEGECVYHGFIQGALSESARIYWQNGMISIEDIEIFLKQNEDDFDRGYGKFYLEDFLKEHKKK